jgi:hypothetical protein
MTFQKINRGKRRRKERGHQVHCRIEKLAAVSEFQRQTRHMAWNFISYRKRRNQMRIGSRRLLCVQNKILKTDPDMPATESVREAQELQGLHL